MFSKYFVSDIQNQQKYVFTQIHNNIEYNIYMTIKIRFPKFHMPISNCIQNKSTRISEGARRTCRHKYRAMKIFGKAHEFEPKMFNRGEKSD